MSNKLYITRSKNGNLLLHQKKPRFFYVAKNWNPETHGYFHKDSKELIEHGNVFRLRDNEYTKKLNIPVIDEEGKNIFPISLRIVDVNKDDIDAEDFNKMWVTRDVTGMLMLHQIKPTRLNQSEEFKMRKTWKHPIRKNGKKWTAWRGHFRIQPFPGSENISYEDEEPTVVTIVQRYKDLPIKFGYDIYNEIFDPKGKVDISEIKNFGGIYFRGEKYLVRGIDEREEFLKLGEYGYAVPIECEEDYCRIRVYDLSGREVTGSVLKPHIFSDEDMKELFELVIGDKEREDKVLKHKMAFDYIKKLSKEQPKNFHLKLSAQILHQAYVRELSKGGYYENG